MVSLRLPPGIRTEYKTGRQSEGLPLTISQQIHTGVGDRIGLAVGGFEAAINELRANGVKFIVEPKEMGSAKFAFIQDARGTTLETSRWSKADTRDIREAQRDPGSSALLTRIMLFSTHLDSGFFIATCSRGAR
jgi:hypothetical protein